MAIDLNKSHYNSDGQKMRVVYPENESPEIYPQREIYPQIKVNTAENYPEPVRKNTAAEKIPPKKHRKITANFLLPVFILLMAVLPFAAILMVGFGHGAENYSNESGVTDTNAEHIYQASEISCIKADVSLTDINIISRKDNPSDKITVKTEIGDRVDVNITLTDGVLSVETEDLTGRGRGTDRIINIFLPDGYNSDITVKAQRDNVYFENCAGDIRLETADSDVILTGSDFGYVSAELKRGRFITDACTADKFSIRAMSAEYCSLDRVVTDELILRGANEYSITNCTVCGRSEIVGHVLYAAGNVFENDASLSAEYELQINDCVFTGNSYFTSLNRYIAVNNTSVENVMMHVSRKPDVFGSYGYISVFLSDSEDKFRVTKDNGEFIFPTEAGSGNYSIYAKTDGGGITVKFDDAPPDISEAESFAKECGFISHTDNKEDTSWQ